MLTNLLAHDTVWLPSDKSGIKVKMTSMITAYARFHKIPRNEVTHEIMLDHLEKWCKRNHFTKQWDLWVAEGNLEVSNK